MGRPWRFWVSVAVTGLRDIDNQAGWGEHGGVPDLG